MMYFVCWPSTTFAQLVASSRWTSHWVGNSRGKEEESIVDLVLAVMIFLMPLALG
ncbi:hypothetical protein TRIATDRAFT_302326 [Trichoderma atroviride IMI 206040]|uniref:Uncharacterized protein n=1 Tax=Hypocrea atroviridis (strain ATCC 20476 / IMI 206040) TaxID=452589 RepID=G9P4U7_HYPAI|nr:uncharacterized protein TRIATDRAFT_302326 [Trichoderma atroviride IMI 206040]EHK42029.1 hypothetical protein TRIATDRAFT_302326 [Trichoderma atroviride IMI 206040]